MKMKNPSRMAGLLLLLLGALVPKAKSQTMPPAMSPTALPQTMPQTMPPSCRDDNLCTADTSESFVTYIEVDFEDRRDTLTLYQWVQMEAAVAQAYDDIAGTACDSCRRRVLDSTIVRPDVGVGASRRRLSELRDDEKERMMQQEIFFDETTVVFRLEMGQTGDCTTAFDSVDGLFTNSDVNLFKSTCDNSFVTYELEGGPEASCCCRCEQSSTDVTTGDFLVRLTILLNPIVGACFCNIESVTELQENDETCDGETFNYDFILFIETDGDFNTEEEQNEFLRIYRDSYNDVCLRLCIAQNMTNITFTDEFSPPDLRFLSSARGRNGRSRERFLTSGRQAMGNGSSKNPVAPLPYRGNRRRRTQEVSRSSPPPPPMRRLPAVSSSFEVDPQAADEESSFEVAMQNPRQLQFLEEDFCLCPPGVEPREEPPSTVEHMVVMNSMLQDENLPQVTMIVQAEDFPLPGPEWNMIVDVPVVIGFTPSSGRRLDEHDRTEIYNELNELFTTSYNDLVFELCDPSVRMVTSTSFVETEGASCENIDQIRGVFTVSVTGYGEIPEDILFGEISKYADKSSKGGKGGKGGKSQSHRDMLEAFVERSLQMDIALCDANAVGFTAPCASGFTNDFAGNLANSTTSMQVEGVDFFFETVCKCSAEVQVPTEIGGIYYLPAFEPPCSHTHGRHERSLNKGSSAAYEPIMPVCGLFECEIKQGKSKGKGKSSMAASKSGKGKSSSGKGKGAKHRYIRGLQAGDNEGERKLGRSKSQELAPRKC